MVTCELAERARRFAGNFFNRERDAGRLSPAVMGVIFDQPIRLPIGYVEPRKRLSKCLLWYIYEGGGPVESLGKLFSHLCMGQCLRSGEVVGFALVSSLGQRCYGDGGYSRSSPRFTSDEARMTFKSAFLNCDACTM